MAHITTEKLDRRQEKNSIAFHYFWLHSRQIKGSETMYTYKLDVAQAFIRAYSPAKPNSVRLITFINIRYVLRATSIL